LRTQSGSSECLRRFEETDRAVFDWFSPFEQRLWDVPGLGREPAEEQVQEAATTTL